MTAPQAQGTSPHGDQPLVQTSSAEVRAKVQERRVEPFADVEVDHVETQAEIDASIAATRARLEQKRAEEVAATVISTGSLPEVPPDRSGPAQRAESSMSPVVQADSNARDVERSFRDLFADFPIGNGQYYIQVIRLLPQVYEGVPTRGELRDITTPNMTFAQFVEEYGGTKYELTVYGPSRKNSKTGKPARYTKPIIVHVPNAVPPNPDAADTDGDAMTDTGPNAQRLGRAGNADARMFETKLQHERDQQDRQDAKERLREQREQARLEQLQREERSKADVALRALADQLEAKTEETRELRAMVEQIRAEQLAAQGQVAKTAANSKAEELKGLAEIFTATGAGKPDAAVLIEQHKNEVKTLTDHHHAEMARLRDGHAAELSRLRDEQAKELRRLDEVVATERATAVSRIKEVEERATSRQKEIEDRAASRIKEVEDRATARVQEIEQRSNAEKTALKEDNDRRVQDIKDRHAERIQDIEREHKRDQDGVKRLVTVQTETEKSSFATQMAIKEQEIARLKADLDEAREEARKPLGERIAELSAAAEELGYSKGGETEQKDWKQVAMEAGAGLVANLPELLRSAGEAVGKARGGQPTAAQIAYAQAQVPVPQVGRPLPPPLRGAHGALLRPRGFATEDGPDFEGPAGVPSVLVPPTAVQQRPPPPPVAPPPALQAQPPMPMQPATSMVPMESMAPVDSAPPIESVPPVEPAAPPNPMAAMVTDANVLQFVPMFESALTSGASPTQVTDYLVETHGAATVKLMVGIVTPERVLQALQANGRETSPLCRRDGQKFLRETYQQIQQRVG